MARSLGPISPHIELANQIQGELSFPAEAQPRAGKKPPMNSHRHVRRNRHVENDSMPAAIFRYISDAMGDGILR